MTLNTVTLIFEEQDAADGTVTGSVTIQPTSVVAAAGIAVVGPYTPAYTGTLTHTVTLL